MMSPAMIVLGLGMLGISRAFSSAVLHNTQEVQLGMEHFIVILIRLP